MAGAAGGGGRILSEEEEKDQIIEELKKRVEENHQIMVQVLKAGNKGESAEEYTKCLNYIYPCVRQDTLRRAIGEDVAKEIIDSEAVDPQTRIPIGDIYKIDKSKSKCKRDNCIRYLLEGETEYKYITDAIKSLYHGSRPTLANSITPDGEIFQEGEPFADMHPFVSKCKEKAGTNGMYSEDLIHSYCEEYPDQNKEQVTERFLDLTRYYILDGTSTGKNKYPAGYLVILENKPMKRLSPSSPPIFDESRYNREETREFLRKAHRNRRLILYSRKKGRKMSIRMASARKPKSITYLIFTEIYRICGKKGKVTGKNCIECGKFVCEKLGCEPNDSYDQMCKSICEALGVDSCDVLNKMKKEKGKIKELVDKRLLEIESSKST